jgi:prevent-host-death family protein
VFKKQMEVGLREANQAFSRIMKAVRRGEEVLLTERGKPLARIVPMRPSGAAEGMVQRLEASGFLRAATKRTRMTVWEPRPLAGPPVTLTLREERDLS